MKMKKLIKNIFNMIHSIVTHSILKALAVVYISFIYLSFGRIMAFDAIRDLPGISLPLVLKVFGAKIGKNVSFGGGLCLQNVAPLNNLTIGNNVHIGKNCFLDLRDKITISDNSTLSMHAKIITHIDMGKSKLSNLYANTSQEVFLGKNVYVGISAILLQGVTIGSNSLVAAKSLVDKSFDENSFIAGSPAELKRKFDHNL